MTTHKRLKASKKMDVNVRGSYPHRLVLIEQQNKVTPFASCREIFPYDGVNNNEPYLVSGDYCVTLEDAEKSWEDRMRRDGVVEDRTFKPDEAWQGN